MYYAMKLDRISHEIRAMLESQQAEYRKRMALPDTYDRVAQERLASKCDEIETAIVRRLIDEFMPSDYLGW